MISTLLSGLVTALSLLVVDLLLPGVQLNTFLAALLAAAAIGVVNSLIKPVLETLTLPVNTLSFGLFSLVVNGLCFWLASLAVTGFRVDGVLEFFVGPILLSAVSTFLGGYVAEKFPQQHLEIKGDLSSQDLPDRQ